MLAFDPAGDVTGGLTRFCHHAQVTAARLAATGAFRRAVAGCGPRVTHPPAQAARLRDRAGTGRPGCPALAVTGRSPVPLPVTAGNCVSPPSTGRVLSRPVFCERGARPGPRGSALAARTRQPGGFERLLQLPGPSPATAPGFSRRAPASPGTAQRPGRRSPLVRQPMTLTFSAWGPFWPWVMSNSTFCPSSRLR
jgi:hypothetical protein